MNGRPAPVVGDANGISMAISGQTSLATFFSSLFRLAAWPAIRMQVVARPLVETASQPAPRKPPASGGSQLPAVALVTSAWAAPQEAQLGSAWLLECLEMCQLSSSPSSQSGCFCSKYICIHFAGHYLHLYARRAIQSTWSAHCEPRETSCCRSLSESGRS